MAQRADDKRIGDWHDSNIGISDEGVAVSPTAIGNTRKVFTVVPGGVRVRRLMGEEVLDIMGFTGKHAVSEETLDKVRKQELPEAMLYQWAGNAVAIPLSTTLCVGIRALYDAAWMRQHLVTVGMCTELKEEPHTGPEAPKRSTGTKGTMKVRAFSFCC